LHKFYFDEIASVLVTFPVQAIAFLSLVLDQGLVDRLVDWVGGIPAAIGRVFRPVQNGLIQTYALIMLVGLAVFLVMIIQAWVPIP
jgi:NADH-quinone oxidoreductase subunit L